MSEPDPHVARAVAALAAGGIAIIGTDTVYGLVAQASDPAAIARIYALKQRPATMPLALLAHSVAALFAALPELDARARRAVEAVLPGPYTLILAAPESRFNALAPAAAGIGVRVPHLMTRARAVAHLSGVLASTSANRHGHPEAASVNEIAHRLRESVDAIVDDGPVAGAPSTVVDLTGAEPQVLREGAVPRHVAIDALSSRNL